MISPIRICFSQEIRELDALCETQYGISSALLMENAGLRAADIILKKYPHAGKSTEILVFAGKGHNAGDAFVLARHLLCLGRKVRTLLLQEEKNYKGTVQKNLMILKALRAKISVIESLTDLEDLLKSSTGPFTLVDGILGTGLKAKLEGLYYDVVDLINSAHSSEIISLDIPSGISADTGAILGNSVRANLCISFGFPKMGHFLPPGAIRRGKLINIDISLPPQFARDGDKFLLTAAPVRALIQERDQYGHKNSFGHSLLIGGSMGRTGAIQLASRACIKMGTGLVTVASWPNCYSELIARLPEEAMSVALELNQLKTIEYYRTQLQQYTSIVIGPGLGLRIEGKALLEDILQNYEGALLLDADALNLVSNHHLHSLLLHRKSPTVLTPHAGEMARLIGWEKDKVTNNPVQALELAVEKTNCVVLLKGAATLIRSLDAVLYLNHYPNDGMATAGSGDVLAGMIGGLMGQGISAFDAATVGVYLHSLAGAHAAEKLGHRSMTSANIIENIAYAFKKLQTDTDTSVLESQIELH